MLIEGKDKFGSFFPSGERRFYFSTDDSDAKVSAKDKAEAFQPKSLKKDLRISDFDSTRMVYMFDQFYQDSAEKLIKDLLALDEADDAPITLMINSYGGSTDALDSILDTINGLTSPINTVCLGTAASCGALLLSMGKDRFIGKNSDALIHEVSAWACGTNSDLKEQVEQIDAVNEKLMSVLAERTGQSIDFMKNLTTGGKDISLTPDEAVAMGLVDAVLLNTEDLIEDLGITNMRINSAKEIDGHISLALKKRLNSVNQSKGANKVMNKEQMIASLKKDHSVDVSDLQIKNAKLGQELAAATEKATTAETKVAELEAAATQKEKETLLEKLVDEGKATQATKEAYKLAFEAMDLDKCKAFVEGLAPVMNMEPESEAAGEGESEDATDPQAELDVKVKAYMKAQTDLGKEITYVDALTVVRGA